MENSLKSQEPPDKERIAPASPALDIKIKKNN
jgi:hypothetical protein